MIVVRNIFQLKFGKAKDAIATWKAGMAIAERVGAGRFRLLTDLAGPDFYTLILEATYQSLADFEQTSQKLMGSPEWQAWYPQVLALCEGGRREILNIVE